MSESSDTSVRRELLLTTMFEVLADQHEPVPAAQVLESVAQRTPLTSVEVSLNASGVPRGPNFLRFASGWARAIGWLDKDGAGWRLTDTGRQAVAKPPEDGFYKDVTRRYRQVHKTRSASAGTDAKLDLLTDALDLVPEGAWTTYGDLATVTGLANQLVGTWCNKSEHPAAHRVLGANGKSSPGFAWADPDRTQTQQEALEAEGVEFDEWDRASPLQRMTAEELRPPVDGESPTRAWLVRGSNVAGVDMVPEWVEEGYCSLSARRLAQLDLPASRQEIAARVEIDYADRTYSVRADRITEFDLFLNRMNAGDLVVTPFHANLVIGRVTGPATMIQSDGGRSNLRRPVEWLNAAEPLNFENIPGPIAAKLKAQHEIVDLSSDVDTLEELVSAEQPDGVAERKARAAELQAPTQQLADELHVELSWLRTVVDLLKARKQLVFYGPPGTGKTYLAKKIAAATTRSESVKLIQFHPAYTYEDFFEGYRPVTKADGQGIGFELRPGPFRKLVEAAREDEHTAYVLIIDEINRANLAKVFGELYFLLEYRDDSIDLLYGSSDATGFTLPENVYLIGTMNTADRSIALVDAAMRRRFAFMALQPDEAPTKDMLRRWLAAEGKPSTFADIHDQLNLLIADRDFKIGPSYFMRPEVHEDGGLDVMWQTAILPLLEEHHFGDGTDVAKRYSLDAIRKRAFNAANASTAEPVASSDVGEHGEEGAGEEE